jgi:hypothetical protein
MAQAFLIGVDTDTAVGPHRRLFLVLDDKPDRATQAVRNLFPNSKVDCTGFTVLPEAVQKLGLMPGQPKQL